MKVGINNMEWKQRNEKIKNFILGEQPYYDSENKSINGCKKYSYSYFHELRHKHQDELTPIHALMTKTYIYEYYLKMCFLMVIVIEIIIAKVTRSYVPLEEYQALGMIFLILALPLIVLNFIAEVDAYIFGYVYYRRYRKQ